MTRADFYEIKDSRWELALCGQVEAAYAAGERLYVRAATEALARELDELLWTFREDSFVPHRLWQGEAEVLVDPVTIGWRAGNPNQATTVVLAGTGAAEDVTGFDRILDFVPTADPLLTQGARERYRAFRTARLKVTFHPAQRS
jgi:DNA polymerase III subunit chi